MLSSNLVDHLLRIWTSDAHVYNVNIPLIKDVLHTKIYFTRLLENRSGSLFKFLSPRENYFHERQENLLDANIMDEKKPREEDRADDTDWHDEWDMLETEGVKRWQWNVDFKGLEAFVQEHGTKGGGLTDGWCINQRWASVTALRAAFQVVDGGAGSVHGGEEIILDR